MFEAAIGCDLFDASIRLKRFFCCVLNVICMKICIMDLFHSIESGEPTILFHHFVLLSKSHRIRKKSFLLQYS